MLRIDDRKGIAELPKYLVIFSWRDTYRRKEISSAINKLSGGSHIKADANDLTQLGQLFIIIKSWGLGRVVGKRLWMGNTI